MMKRQRSDTEKNYESVKKQQQKNRKHQHFQNPTVSKTSNNKTMLLSKCAICGTKKSNFIEIKKQVEY